MLSVFKAKSYADKNILVAYGVFPEWAIRAPQIDDVLLKNSLDFYQSISEQQRSELNGGVAYAQLSLLQRDLMAKIFIENPVPSVSEPEHRVIARRKTFENIVENEKAIFQISVSPYVFLYANGGYLGKVAIAAGKPYELDTKSRRLDPDVGVLSWARFPMRIEPSTQVHPDIATNVVSFGSKPQSLSVEEVLRHIDPSGRKLIADKALKNIKVVAFGEAVKVSDVISALNIALGSQSRTVGAVTFLSRSWVHQVVAETALTVLDSVYTQDTMAQGFSRLIGNALNAYESPFPERYFLSGQLYILETSPC